MTDSAIQNEFAQEPSEEAASEMRLCSTDGFRKTIRWKMAVELQGNVPTVLRSTLTKLTNTFSHCVGWMNMQTNPSARALSVPTPFGTDQGFYSYVLTDKRKQTANPKASLLCLIPKHAIELFLRSMRTVKEALLLAVQFSGDTQTPVSYTHLTLPTKA